MIVSDVLIVSSGVQRCIVNLASSMASIFARAGRWEQDTVANTVQLFLIAGRFASDLMTQRPWVATMITSTVVVFISTAVVVSMVIAVRVRQFVRLVCPVRIKDIVDP